MLQKDQYYWTQLRRALVEGQWLNPCPSKAPNGTALSWSELFRKFNKHCKGFYDIAEIANQTRVHAALLASGSTDEDQDDQPLTGVYPLELGDECILPEERIEDAMAGYDILKELQSSHLDTLSFSLAYYDYALGNPTKCLSHLSNVPDLLHLQNIIPSESQPNFQASAPSLRVSLFGTGSTSSTGGTFASLATSTAPEINDGRAWAMTETIRSLCLQGMSYEKLAPSHPQQAIKSFGAALPLLSLIVTEMAPNAISGTSGRINLVAFTLYRELWRWVERLLWRAIIVSSRTSNVHEDGSLSGDAASVWTWFEQYHACSVYWPPDFRTAHRSAISVLYLRAFILRYGATSHHSSLASSHSEQKPPAWLHRARWLVSEYRAILNVSTTFPRAGERNVKVEDFVDLCVGVWEASGCVGEAAGWVVDILWWATRLTFNSHGILRHLTRLLYASGDPSLARRTLLLYMQVVGKAWQASGGTSNQDTDSNQRWVETLVSGSRMLCKTASSLPGREGIDEVREARICLDKVRTRLDEEDKRLRASVDLAEGVWNSVMALKEQDPRTRPKRFADAHTFLLQSVGTYPTPAAHFHLALSFARLGPTRDMEQAVANAGMAVEGDPSEIRYWHLLGLLLAAMEQWKAAAEILDRGAGLGFEIEDDGGESERPEEKDDGTLGGNASVASVETISNGPGDSKRQEGDGRGRKFEALLKADTAEIPEMSTLLMPARDHLPSTQSDVFEHALQLRISQGALTEVVEGPEGAEVKWLEVFRWVAEKRGQSEGTPRQSLDGSRPSAEKDAIANGTGLSEKTVEPPPIPITICPATPDTETAPERNSSEKKGNTGSKLRRSSSIDRDTSKSKKVQQMLKHRVHQGHVRITSISKKIGSGVVRNSGGLKRSLSTPDFHAILRQTSYQASSIHSRRRVSSIMQSQDSQQDEGSETPPPALSPVPQAPQQEKERKRNSRLARSNRLIADLWLMSAATFRRLGKIEQAKGSIQEAEVRGEGNPGVWVQLGLYYVALNKRQSAISSFRKALFINPDDVSACVHLARIYLEGTTDSSGSSGVGDDGSPRRVEVDLAAGILSQLTRGDGWDVAEAWYFLAKAYGAQGRREREKECLEFALELSERRGVREMGSAVGWCL